MKLLFLLTAGPRSEAVLTVSKLVHAAAGSGHRVEVFLAGDGVTHAKALAGSASVTLCEADLRWRQNEPGQLAGVRRGSLRDLARLAQDADRILVFR